MIDLIFYKFSLKNSGRNKNKFLPLFLGQSYIFKLVNIDVGYKDRY